MCVVDPSINDYVSVEVGKFPILKWFAIFCPTTTAAFHTTVSFIGWIFLLCNKDRRVAMFLRVFNSHCKYSIILYRTTAFWSNFDPSRCIKLFLISFIYLMFDVDLWGENIYNAVMLVKPTPLCP